MNSSLVDVYREETDSGQRICDRVSMTAEFTDAFAAARLDAAPFVVRGRYHLPHPYPADSAPALAPPAPSPHSAHTRRQHDSDVLQARRFIELLDDELAEQQMQAATLRRRTKQGTDKHLGSVAVRINEIQAMRDALIRRFPTA